MFLYLLINLLINITFLYRQVFSRLVKEANETTTLQAHFFYNTSLYWMTNLFITITFVYWQVFSWLKHFAQMNVFAWIPTVFAQSIIGCASWLPIIDKLRYKILVLSHVSLQLRTSNNAQISVKLGDKLCQCTTVSGNYGKVIPSLLYILLKYGASNECYHEMTMLFLELPKSYKVINHEQVSKLCM